MDQLRDLQEWFESVCDGDWEHAFGITIQTLDNPGWAVDVDLMDTSLGQIDFIPTQVERTEQDWLLCKVENGKFIGRGGPANLIEILGIFTTWAKKQGAGLSATAGR
jgi:hypothetical protein